MSLRINTNIAAMNALRHLQTSSNDMQTVTQRLATGLRINSASDDPAGLINSEGMRTQIKGIEQALRNSQDAVNMSKTAEGALEEIQRLIRDMRGLAVHSANTAVVDTATLQANQSQIRSSLQSIDRIAGQTQFGTKTLLDGTAGAMANVTAPTQVSSIYVGGTFNNLPVVSGPITIDRVTTGTRATVALGGTFANANTIVSTSGSFVVNGYSFSTNGTETVQTIVSKINEMSSTTGVTAQLSGAGPVSVTLSQNNFGSQFSINYFDPLNILHNAGSATSTGVNAVFNVSMTTTSGVQTVTFTGGRGPQESGLRLSDSLGNSIRLTESGNSSIAAPTAVGVLTASAVRFQIGGNGNQSVQYSMPVVFANRLGTGIVSGLSLADLDVTTPQGAQDAMRIIDEAVKNLAQQRGELGSFQKNFLESTLRSLDVARENLTSTESQIRDADVAVEITQMTRLQILQQTGMAVLSQANQQPQSVLSLLRN